MFILMKVVNMWWYCCVFLWFIILISSFLQKLIITIIIIFINWLISVSVSLQSTPFPSFSPFDHLLLILHLKNHTISFQSTLLNFPYYSNKNIHDRSKTIRELIHTHPLTFLSLYFTHLDCLTVVILHLHFNCFRLAASDLLSLPAFQPPSKKNQSSTISFTWFFNSSISHMLPLPHWKITTEPNTKNYVSYYLRFITFLILEINSICTGIFLYTPSSTTAEYPFLSP